VTELEKKLEKHQYENIVQKSKEHMTLQSAESIFKYFELFDVYD